jgi:hypothetical protein
MTKKQLRHIDAAINGDKALTKYNGLFGTDGPLMLRQTNLQNAIGTCSDYILKQKRNLGYRENTLHDLQTMEGRAWAISKITHEYAIDINDSTLAGKVAYDKSDFSHGSILQMKSNAQAVYDAVNGAVATAMIAAGYHITAQDVTDLHDIIADVEDDMGLPKADIASAKAATTGLNSAVKDDVDPAIERIVDYLTPYALTHLFEYNTVVDAFEIPQVGMRHIALRIRVSDSETHTRGTRAVINIEGALLDESKKKARLSSRRGIVDYSHEDLPEGNYKVTVSLDGYETAVFEDVAVFDSRMTLLDVQLKEIE